MQSRTTPLMCSQLPHLPLNRSMHPSLYVLSIQLKEAFLLLLNGEEIPTPSSRFLIPPRIETPNRGRLMTRCPPWAKYTSSGEFQAACKPLCRRRASPSKGVTHTGGSGRGRSLRCGGGPFLGSLGALGCFSGDRLERKRRDETTGSSRWEPEDVLGFEVAGATE
jgi:hypothetical protein